MSIFDHCEFHCINLDTRPDRWKLVEKEFQKLSLKKKLFRKSANTEVVIKNSRLSAGEHSLIKTNLELLRSGSGKALCIFEDDVYFLSPGKVSVLMRRVSKQLRSDFDVLYLGAHLFDKKIKHPLISKNLVHFKPEPNPTAERDHVNIGGAHAIIFSPKVIEFICSLADDITFDAPWDVFIAKHIVPRNNSFMVYPPFAFQRQDFSNLENKIATRDWIIAHNEKRIRKGVYFYHDIFRFFAKLKRFVYRVFGV